MCFVLQDFIPNQVIGPFTSNLIFSNLWWGSAKMVWDIEGLGYPKCVKLQSSLTQVHDWGRGEIMGWDNVDEIMRNTKGRTKLYFRQPSSVDGLNIIINDYNRLQLMSRQQLFREIACLHVCMDSLNMLNGDCRHWKQANIKYQQRKSKINFCNIFCLRIRHPLAEICTRLMICPDWASE